MRLFLPLYLNTRIKKLREALLLDRTLDGYELTSRGYELFKLIESLGMWSLGWAKEIVARQK